MAKLVRLSSDNITFHSLPTNSGALSVNGEVVNDSIHGTTFDSQFTSLLNWELSADGIYKGVAGYQTCILRQGTSTATTGEALALVSGQTYRVSDAAKEIIDAGQTLTVFDGVTDVTAQVESIDYLFGTITFVGTYTVLGAVTADYNYLPVAAVGRFNSFTLSQSVNSVDDSDFQTLKANNGYRLNTQGLRTVTLEASGIFNAADDFQQDLQDRNVVILEIQADGNGYSKARGYFQIGNVEQSGNVGDNEVESVTFNLNVPSSDYSPFSWDHNPSSTLSQALIVALNAFNDETNVFVEYLPNGIGGAGGKTGQGIITDISLESSIDDMPRFTVTVSGDGAIVDA